MNLGGEELEVNWGFLKHCLNCTPDVHGDSAVLQCNTPTVPNGSERSTVPSKTDQSNSTALPIPSAGVSTKCTAYHHTTQSN